jgi:hypothetical protein
MKNEDIKLGVIMKKSLLFKLSLAAVSANLFVILSITSTAKADGGSMAGGGGYVTENSLRLLKETSQELAHSIRNSTPFVLSKLPSKMPREKLASIIENIRLEPQTDKARDGADLLFDYGVDAKGPYISALRTYFVIYGAVPMKFQKKEALIDMKLDLKLKLLHESAHLLGLGEKDAEAFGMEVLRALEADLILCVPQNKASDPRILLNKKCSFSLQNGGGFSENCDWMISRSHGVATVDHFTEYPESITAIKDGTSDTTEFSRWAAEAEQAGDKQTMIFSTSMTARTLEIRGQRLVKRLDLTGHSEFRIVLNIDDSKPTSKISAVGEGFVIETDSNGDFFTDRKATIPFKCEVLGAPADLKFSN